MKVLSKDHVSFFSLSDRGVDTRFRANHITNMLAICKLGHFRAMKILITKWSRMQVNLYQGLARFNVKKCHNYAVV